MIVAARELSTPTYRHESTSRILLSGGVDGYQSIRRCREPFPPAHPTGPRPCHTHVGAYADTGRCRPGHGQLPSGRFSHCSTVMTSGDVIVVGGSGGHSILNYLRLCKVQCAEHCGCAATLWTRRCASLHCGVRLVGQCPPTAAAQLTCKFRGTHTCAAHRRRLLSCCEIGLPLPVHPYASRTATSLHEPHTPTTEEEVTATHHSGGLRARRAHQAARLCACRPSTCWICAC